MNNFFHTFKDLERSPDTRERKIFHIIAASCLVLILGGIIMFFAEDSALPKEGVIELTCHDSDGFDPKTKGAVTYTDAAGKHVDEDSCDLSEKTLYEMTCRKPSFFGFSSIPEKKTVVCPKGCINGACAKQ
jgi:hypothetical protein